MTKFQQRYGCTVAELAKREGVCKTTIYNRLRSTGHPFAPGRWETEHEPPAGTWFFGDAERFEILDVGENGELWWVRYGAPEESFPMIAFLEWEELAEEGWAWWTTPPNMPKPRTEKGA